MSEKKGLVQEFKEFLTTGDLMSIAVAFIMGLAVKGLIDSFVKDIFTGTIGLFVECKDILDATGKKIGSDCSGLTGKAYKSLAWGNFLNSIINFVIIAFVVFWIVKVYKKSTKRDLAQDGPSEVDLLTEIRDEGTWLPPLDRLEARVAS
ncbi:MAG: MscL family protein, partial [Ilumatobacteraceae bacterium]